MLIRQLANCVYVDMCTVDDIEAAMHLSADEFKTKYGFAKPSASGPPVIVYCMAGVRAERAAKLFSGQFGIIRFVLEVLKWCLSCSVQCRSGRWRFSTTSCHCSVNYSDFAISRQQSFC